MFKTMFSVIVRSEDWSCVRQKPWFQIWKSGQETVEVLIGRALFALYQFLEKAAGASCY